MSNRRNLTVPFVRDKLSNVRYNSIRSGAIKRRLSYVKYTYFLKKYKNMRVELDC